MQPSNKTRLNQELSLEARKKGGGKSLDLIFPPNLTSTHLNVSAQNPAPSHKQATPQPPTPECFPSLSSREKKPSLSFDQASPSPNPFKPIRACRAPAFPFKRPHDLRHGLRQSPVPIVRGSMRPSPRLLLVCIHASEYCTQYVTGRQAGRRHEIFWGMNT